MIEEIITLSLKAAQAVLKLYDSGFEIYEKKDKSALTSADIISHKILIKGLTKSFPQIPVLSEESEEIPFQKRKNWKKFFLVDPLDGTRGFIKKNGEFTINIALIEERTPVLGVIVSPVNKKIYFAESRKGAYLKEDGRNRRLPLFSRTANGVRVIRGRSRPCNKVEALINTLKSHYKTIEMTQIGSSLKFCKIAEGSADIYPRFGLTSEWDTAAGHTLLSETEGEIKKISSKDSLIYNKESTLNPHFIAKWKGIK